MNADPAAPEREPARPARRSIVWAARILTALPIVIMLMSAAMKLSGSPVVLEQFVGRFGYPEATLRGIAALEIACIVLYAVPRTAVLGAVLVTGYLGGAVATHVRVGDVFLGPLALGVIAWAGIYLRDDRLRALLPLRKTGRP